jgi:hypothetical protein
LIQKNKEVKRILFRSGERKEGKKKITGNKLLISHRHMPHYEDKDVTTLQTTWWKDICGHREASHTLLKKGGHLARDEQARVAFLN